MNRILDVHDQSLCSSALFLGWIQGIYASDKINEISLIEDLVIGFWIITEPIIVFDMFL